MGPTRQVAVGRGVQGAGRPEPPALLDSLNRQAGQTLGELCAGLDMARQSVSKHLAVLEAANLVTTVWRGREKLHYLNAEPINAIADRWISQYDRARVRALADLKTALEDSQMDTPQLRLRDLHQHHAGTPMAGPDRAGVHPTLLGDQLYHRLDQGIPP